MLKDEVPAAKRERSDSIVSHDNNDKVSSTNAMSNSFVNNIKSKMGGSALTRKFSHDRIHITRILLTGGPCAGKTTAMASIS
jgi:hypothetical protein